MRDMTNASYQMQQFAPLAADLDRQMRRAHLICGGIVWAWASLVGAAIIVLIASA